MPELRDLTFARSCIAWTLFNYQDNKFSCFIFTRMQRRNGAIWGVQILHNPLVWKILQKHDLDKAMCKISIYFRDTASQWNWKNIMKMDFFFKFSKRKRLLSVKDWVTFVNEVSFLLEVSKSKIKYMFPQKIIGNYSLVTLLIANKGSFLEYILQNETNQFPF